MNGRFAFAGIFLIVLFLLIILSAALTYTGHRDNLLVRTVERVLPMPAAVIGYRHFIPFTDLAQGVQATRNFYEGEEFANIGVRVDFSTDKGQKKLKLWERTILDRLIEDRVVEILAAREGITITDGQVSAQVNQELGRYGRGLIAQESMQKLWGFTLADFEQRIVKPQLYREALESVIQKKRDMSSYQQRILEAKATLDGGAEFVRVAQDYSEGATASEAGMSGWFGADDLLPEVADVAFTLPIGSYSDVIEARNGFHIIKVEDRRNGAIGDQALLRNIIVFKPQFAEWLDEQIRTFTVHVPMQEYYWNTETYHVDLEDSALQELAAEIVNEAIAPTDDNTSETPSTEQAQ